MSVEHSIEENAVVNVETVTTIKTHRSMVKAWAHEDGVRLMVSSRETGAGINDHDARYLNLSREQAAHLVEMIERAIENSRG